MTERKQKKCKLTRNIFIFGLLLLLGISWLPTSLADLENKDLVHELSKRNLNFAFKYFKMLADRQDAVISPFSLSVTLVMTSFGAGHNTLKQINDALELNGFNDHRAIAKGYASALKSLDLKGDITLIISNKMFIEKSYSIKQEFKDILVNDFHSVAESVNFLKDGQTLNNEINKWVEQTTNNKMKNLIPLPIGDKSLGAVLVSAIYFKGAWQQQFQKQNTKIEPFQSTNGNVQFVPMMNTEAHFNYAENNILQSKILQLKYSGSRISMCIFLPNKPGQIKQLKQNLNSKLIENIRNSMKSNLVTVKLPKFNSKFSKDLNTDLPMLQITDLFNEINVDLSGIANALVSGSHLFVKKVLYAAYVEVDEMGAEAGGVPGGVEYGGGERGTLRSNAPIVKPLQFYANHSFVYTIHDSLTNFILFIGSVDNPSNSVQ